MLGSLLGPFLPLLLPTGFLEERVPEKYRDIIIIGFLCAITFGAVLGYYLLFPHKLTDQQRTIGVTCDETVVIIGGGYGPGTDIALKFRTLLFNVAIVDFRDHQGNELPRESKRDKKIRDKLVIQMRKGQVDKVGRKSNEGSGDTTPAEGSPAEGTPAEGSPVEGSPVEGSPAEGEVEESPQKTWAGKTRVYKCDPDCCDLQRLEQIKSHIEVDLGKPTILIYAYTPSVAAAGTILTSYKNTLDAFLPGLKENERGGMVVTAVSSLAHVDPGPPYLEKYAAAQAAVREEHYRTQRELVQHGKYDVKTVLVEIGQFDDRCIDIPMNFEKALDILEKKAKRDDRKTRFKNEPNPSDPPKHIRLTREEFDAIRTLNLRKITGPLARNIPDDDIGRAVFHTVRNGLSDTIWVPKKAFMWKLYKYTPKSLRRWLDVRTGLVDMATSLKDLHEEKKSS